MSMNSDEYLSQRLDQQIDWYDQKSGASQRSFKRLRIIEIVVAASIPLLVGFSTDALPALKLLAGLAGVIVAVVSGLLALNRYQENWVNYRTTCESLRHHKYRFLTGADPYSDGDSAFHHLVGNVEALVSAENINWAEYAKTKSKEKIDGE